jgi:hypothetical protein
VTDKVASVVCRDRDGVGNNEKKKKREINGCHLYKAVHYLGNVISPHV